MRKISQLARIPTANTEEIQNPAPAVQAMAQALTCPSPSNNVPPPGFIHKVTDQAPPLHTAARSKS